MSLETPWEALFDGKTWYVPGVITGCDKETAEHVVLLHNAYLVKMWRGFFTAPQNDGTWIVMRLAKDLISAPAPVPVARKDFTCFSGDDPDSPLIEADEWYKENIEDNR